MKSFFAKYDKKVAALSFQLIESTNKFIVFLPTNLWQAFWHTTDEK